MNEPTTQCPRGHPLGSEPGCGVPECLWAAALAGYCSDELECSDTASAVAAIRAAIEPLEGRVRELERAAWVQDGIVKDYRSRLSFFEEALAAKDAELQRVREVGGKLLAEAFARALDPEEPTT